jgi:tyrosine decarboxylase/aspartate 1-decarboxylase
MRDKGLSKHILLEELEKRIQNDATYDSGKIIGSMCTRPHSLAKYVYTRCLEKNLGDPGLFPATAQLEREAVQMLGSLLSNPNAAGYIVSGGTEANTLSLWVARNLSRKEHGEVIVPVSAHVSFEKAADLLGLKLIKIKLNDFQVDVKAVEDAITPKTVAIIGVAGSTGLGTVDPISELSEIALAHDTYLHVDAAFGGFTLPFLKELGLNVPDFDFRLPGVCAITIDPHKMGLAPIPAGGIVFRNEAMTKVVRVNVPYMSGGEVEQNTLLGTRSGASAAAVWTLLNYFGREGYAAIMKRCMKLTWKLAEEINQINGVSLVTPPTMNIVGIKSDVIDIQLIAQKLRNKGWAVALFPAYMRIVIMPHLKPAHIESFLEDLRRVIRELS